MNQFDDTNDLELEDLARAEFEDQLTLAMRHVDPPAGFADRVLAKAVENEPRRAKIFLMPRRVQLWAGGAVAAALILGAFGFQQQHERRLRAEEAARAQQQYEQALQITGETLDHVRAQLQQAGISLGD